MTMVHERIRPEGTGLDILLQKPRMTEREKEEFLKKFSADNDRTLLGMAVLGGMFSESIDLVGDKLSGAIIVGVGMPQICEERNIIRDFFEEKYGKGFEYAYVYPGMNKVLQAAGRVIRTEKDRGVVLLIDDRYGQRDYRSLFPSHWSDPESVSSPEEVRSFLEEFWGQANIP
jgi:DNA excision repair protein ERCC-2